MQADPSACNPRKPEYRPDQSALLWKTLHSFCNIIGKLYWKKPEQRDQIFTRIPKTSKKTTIYARSMAASSPNAMLCVCDVDFVLMLNACRTLMFISPWYLIFVHDSLSLPFPLPLDPSNSILNLGPPTGLPFFPSPCKNSQENSSALPASFQTTTWSPV